MRRKAIRAVPVMWRLRGLLSGGRGPASRVVSRAQLRGCWNAVHSQRMLDDPGLHVTGARRALPVLPRAPAPRT